jgi:hypothetical protein
MKPVHVRLSRLEFASRYTNGDPAGPGLSRDRESEFARAP